VYCTIAPWLDMCTLSLLTCGELTLVNYHRQRWFHSLILLLDLALDRHRFLELFHVVQCFTTTARSDRSAAVLWLQSRRNNDGNRKPTSPVLPRTHAEEQKQSTPQHSTLSLSLARVSIRAESG